MKRIGRMKKKLALLILALLPVVARGQSSIKVQGQNIVALDEQFSLTFVIEAPQDKRPTDFRWSPGDDFQVVWGPQTGTSTSIVTRNGSTTTTSQFTYSYILLARKEGKFQLPAATASVGGNQISSNPYSVEVVKGGSSGAGSAASSSSSRGSASSRSADISSDDLFMRLTLSRKSAVIGEPVTAVLKFYQKVDIAGFEDVRFPSFNGFWSQVLEQPTNINFQREVLGDKIYNTALLRSWVLVPQQAGELTIDASELTCLVNITVPGRSSSIFDSFFDDNVRTIRKRVTAPAVKLPVSKLPAGAPESFGGGVGQYSMTASLSRDSLAAHEAASLTITITGTGNVSLLEAPKVNFPPDFEAYDVKTTDKTIRGGTSGSKTFEFPFIPRSRGNFTLEPVEWSYYDSNTHKYVTLTTEPMSIPVSGDAAAPASASQGSGIRIPERSGVRNLSEDIRYIRTGKPSLGKGTPMLVSRAVYPVLLALMLLGTAGYILLRKRSERRKADVAGTRNRRATKMALGRLSASKAYLEKNLDSAFYEELHKALIGYISDKFNMPQEELDKDNIATRLRERGVSDELASEYTGLLDTCEFARYSPASGDGALKAHYDAAVKVISSVDSTMKNKGFAAKGAVTVAVMLLALAPSAMAEGHYADSLWTEGSEAYADGLWQEAARSWQALEDDGYISSVLSYNLGNAYFKSGENAKAILHYERALRADPSFADARNNLEYANSLVQDRIDVVPEFILEAWGRSACYSLKSDVWAVLSLIFFAATCVLAVGFFLSSGKKRRRCFFFGLATLLLFLLCLDFANWQRQEFGKKDAAIVMAPVSAVKNSPAGGSAVKDLFVLHEGVKVKILDSVGQFTNIELSDGRQGWISTTDIEII